MAARQYDVDTNQVFSWGNFYAEASDAAVPQALSMVVTREPPAALPHPSPLSPVLIADVIEIELPGG